MLASGFMIARGVMPFYAQRRVIVVFIVHMAPPHVHQFRKAKVVAHENI